MNKGFITGVTIQALERPPNHINENNKPLKFRNLSHNYKNHNTHFNIQVFQPKEANKSVETPNFDLKLTKNSHNSATIPIFFFLKNKVILAIK